LAQRACGAIRLETRERNQSTMLLSLPSAPWRPNVALAALLVLLGACASNTSSLPQRPGIFGTLPGSAGAPGPPISPSLPGVPGIDSRGAPRNGRAPASPLATEQRFLEAWFGGTPVVIASQPPATLQVEVPLAYSFDIGKADVKPALDKVLERLALSLRRQEGSRLLVVTPGDARGAADLAQLRGQSVRDNLARKGIAATLVDLIDSPQPGGPVQLRMTMPGAGAQPVARRRDRGALASTGGLDRQSATRPGWVETK
jgi:hypothetical protein